MIPIWEHSKTRSFKSATDHLCSSSAPGYRATIALLNSSKVLTGSANSGKDSQRSAVSMLRYRREYSFLVTLLVMPAIRKWKSSSSKYGWSSWGQLRSNFGALGSPREGIDRVAIV